MFNPFTYIYVCCCCFCCYVLFYCWYPLAYLLHLLLFILLILSFIHLFIHSLFTLSRAALLITGADLYSVPEETRLSPLCRWKHVYIRMSHLNKNWSLGRYTTSPILRGHSDKVTAFDCDGKDCDKLQALVYDILPPTSAIIIYSICHKNCHLRDSFSMVLKWQLVCNRQLGLYQAFLLYLPILLTPTQIKPKSF